MSIINNSQTFIPNEEQTNCISKVNKFIEEHKPFSKLLINGSAGTGKTTIIISSIVNILITQIIKNVYAIEEIIKENTKEPTYKKPKWDKLKLNIFIISAPTNKAKDVLFTKYNIYIEEQLNKILENTIDTLFVNNNIILNLHIKSILNVNLVTQIINSKISFLTVSQVLSIGRVINEMGIEEFTKGNDKKIIDKYNTGVFLNTSIIVDECSMIDKNTSRLLELIKCPIIYIGDYCQLPPVNEDISTVFTLYDKESTTTESTKTIESTPVQCSNIHCINLKIVERCKNDITLIANCLRDKIYDVTPQFNLLKYTAPDLIIYNKKFSIWLDSYINDIKEKQKQLYVIDSNNTLSSSSSSTSASTSASSSNIYDTMALGWTNKCCLYLNKKIRSLLFSEVNNIDNYYIIKGDKLLIKTPYYKYDNHIYSSTIVYVSRVEKQIYKPINFKDWCDITISINDLQQKKTEKPESSLDIDINNILDIDTKLTIPIITKSTNTPVSNTPVSKQVNKSINILNYFGKKDNKDKKDSEDTSNTSNTSIPLSLEDVKKEKEKVKEKELQYFRKLFYTKHILADIINNDLYDFTDEISLKYNFIVTGYDLHNIKKLSSMTMRINAYTKWHKTMSSKLFGIPNDRICCKKCAFFVKKFSKKANSDQSNYISDFISATDKLEFEMFLCDLVTFTSNGKTVSSNIPILDITKQCNIEALDIIRNIIKNSYEVKLMLSKQDEFELKLINKSLGEEENSTEKTTKYITMSQMFGHYMSHVIKSSYLEIDYGYVLTVHKSQGSTYDNVYVEYSNILSNSKELEKHKLLYTAITRCINKLHIYY